MKTMEYRVARLEYLKHVTGETHGDYYYSPDPDTLMVSLNSVAKEGWCLNSTVFIGGVLYGIFERGAEG